MKVFVTGHEGFIGRQLCERLKDDNALVVGYDLHSRCDILDTKALNTSLGMMKYDVLIHLAALTSVEESHRRPDDYFRVNAEGTKNIVKAAEQHGIPKILYAATAASLDRSSSPYAASKKEGELTVEGFKGQHSILRLFNVVGRRSNPNYCGVIDSFRDGIKKGSITIYGDGNQTRDFVHIRDVCDAFVLASRRDASLPSVSCEIGSGKEMSINTLAEMMVNNANVKINHAPERQEVRRSVANIQQAQDTLGFRPNYSISEFFV